MLEFKYDSYVSDIYAECIHKLRDFDRLEVGEFFDSLKYPKHWDRHSRPVKIDILSKVLKQLIENDIVVLKETKDGDFIKSLLFNSPLITRRFTL